MSREHFAVCITRTCGSGGTEIGKMLAQKLGVDLYDRKLLRLASDDSGIDEKLFARVDEDTRKTPLYKVSREVYRGEVIPPESGNFTSDRNLFEYQGRVLRGLLDAEDFVVLGRAADYVLRDRPGAISVFLTASDDACQQREMEMRQTDDLLEVNRYIRGINRYRSDYYKYHTGRKWREIGNYDLVLRTDRLGYEGCVDVICRYIEERLKRIR